MLLGLGAGRLSVLTTGAFDWQGVGADAGGGRGGGGTKGGIGEGAGQKSWDWHL